MINATLLLVLCCWCCAVICDADPANNTQICRDSPAAGWLTPRLFRLLRTLAGHDDAAAGGLLGARAAAAEAAVNPGAASPGNLEQAQDSELQQQEEEEPGILDAGMLPILSLPAAVQLRLLLLA